MGVGLWVGVCESVDMEVSVVVWIWLLVSGCVVVGLDLWVLGWTVITLFYESDVCAHKIMST